MLKSRITRATDATRSVEFWIGEVECCGGEWTFAVFGPGSDPIESYVYASQGAAERARATMFTMLGRRTFAVVIDRSGEE
jgi:hypothetical protein